MSWCNLAARDSRMTAPTDLFDVFLSYRQADAAIVRRLANALESASLRVWIDNAEIADFESIQRRIQDGLARSKTLLAWYSTRYPESRACQWELTAAYVAARQTAADPRERVLLVNPEPTNGHIHPVDLRDAKFLTVDTSASDASFNGLAVAVQARVSLLGDSLGTGQMLASPRWHGSVGTGSNRFVGRLSDLWRVHTALWKSQHTIITGAFSGATTQLTGLGGVGKSLLAEEYALRFGAAYPGGVFWIRAFGNDTTRRKTSAEDQLAALHDQIRTFAIDLGVKPSGLSRDEIAAGLAYRLDEAQLPFLWIVDDVENGLQADDLARWRAPGRFGKTLMTTRSREYDAMGEVLRVDALPPDDAYALLTSRRSAKDEDDRQTAIRVSDALGYHPLALDVAGAAIRYYSSYAEFEQGLASPSEDALEMAKEYAGVLPNGHEPSIAATLLSSVQRLGAEGTDFLAIASQLAVAPISLDLCSNVLSRTDGTDAERGRARARAAFNQVDKLSLAEDTSADAPSRIVHGLVSRVMGRRMRGVDEARLQQLRTAVTDALAEILVAAADIRLHKTIEAEVAHAREIVAEARDLRGAALLNCVARYDHERGFAPKSSAALRKQWSLRERLQGPEHMDTLGSMNNLGLSLYAEGNLRGAREIQDELLVLLQRLLGPKHVETLKSMNNLAKTLQAQGEVAEARKLFEEVLADSKQRLGPEHTSTLTAMSNLAVILNEQGDVPASRALAEEVLAHRKRLLGDGDPETLTSMSILGLVRYAEGDFSGAQALQVDVLAQRKVVLGPEHPETLRSMTNLACTFQAQGDLTSALALHEQAFAQFTRLLGSKHPSTLTSMSNVALVLYAQGDLTGARTLQQEALGLYEQALGPEHVETLGSMNRLGATLSKLGDVAAAQALREELLAKYERVRGPEHRDTLGAMNRLAITLSVRGDLEGARALEERALAVSKRLLGPEHPHTTASVWNLLQTLLSLDQTEAAKRLVTSDLSWLLAREPASLGADEGSVRERVAQLLRGWEA
jgi:tetratricopeptide (TPR) repeat protein